LAGLSVEGALLTKGTESAMAEVQKARKKVKDADAVLDKDILANDKAGAEVVSAKEAKARKTLQAKEKNAAEFLKKEAVIDAKIASAEHKLNKTQADLVVAEKVRQTRLGKALTAEHKAKLARKEAESKRAAEDVKTARQILNNADELKKKAESEKAHHENALAAAKESGDIEKTKKAADDIIQSPWLWTRPTTSSAPRARASSGTR